MHLAELRKGGRLNNVVSSERRAELDHPLAESGEVVVGERSTEELASSTDNLPVGSGCSREGGGSTGSLDTAFSVDVSSGLLGVGGTGEDDIGKLGTLITVVTLVDDERVTGDGGRVDLISTEEPDDLGLSLGNLG